MDDVTHIKIPTGKNGGTKVPLTVLVMLLGIILWFTRELMATSALSQDNNKILETMEVQTDLLRENRDLNRDILNEVRKQ